MRAYRLLRILFIIGMTLSLILYFVPRYKPSGSILNAWTATGGIERHVSSFDLCLLLVRTGNPAWGAYYIALSAIELVLLLLALRHPGRWVFIVGSSEQLYLLIAFLLRPKSAALSEAFFSAFLTYAAWAMSLTGFFVKPPGTIATGRVSEAPFREQSSA